MDILIQEEFIKKAKKLHRIYPAADAHLDLAGEILIRQKNGEKNIIQHYYLEHWKKAGIKLILSSVYVPANVLEEGNVQGAWENALSQIQALKEEIAGSRDLFLVTAKKDINKVRSGDKIGILIYMEGLDCIGEDVRRLESLFQLGVRGASLTWSRANALANGCCKAGEYKQVPGGLTKTGIEVLRELERLSMFLDVSHLNDDGFSDVVRLARRPFWATHSCAKDIWDNYRNLTRQQMKELADMGGVVGLNGCKLITGAKEGNHLQMLCAHAEYETELIGAMHVGFGFDLCDSYDRGAFISQQLQGEKKTPEQIARLEKRAKTELERMDCFENHSQIICLTAALLQRGMKTEDMIMIMGGSVLQYLEQILPM